MEGCSWWLAAEVPMAAPAPAIPNKDEINGAHRTNNGAPISEVKSRNKPCNVPPRDMIMMDRMNVTVRTGPAMSHDANPKNGIMANTQVIKMRIQLVFTRCPNERGACWTMMCAEPGASWVCGEGERVVVGRGGGEADCESGYPQPGHCGAVDDTCREHSGHEIRAILMQFLS